MRILVMCMLAISVMAASEAGALYVETDGSHAGSVSDWYYAVQDTRDAAGAKYYGWRGARGWIYIAKMGAFADPQGPSSTHENTCLSFALASPYTRDSVQGGLWRWWGEGHPHTYVEFVVDGDVVYRDFANDVPVPSGHYAEVRSWSRDAQGRPIWRVRVANTVWSDGVAREDNGRATVQAELEQMRPYQSAIGTFYFGTNRSSYAGSTYALDLQGGNGEWQDWDEDLTVGTTLAHDEPGMTHYSAGVPYYSYFAGRAD